MNLEDITLSEISQSPKDKYCMIPLRVVTSIVTKSRKVAARGWGRRRGSGELLFKKHRVAVLQDETSSEDKWW